MGGPTLEKTTPEVCSPPGVSEGYQGNWSHVNGAKDSFTPSPRVPGVTAWIDPGLRFKGTGPVQLREDHVVVIRTDLAEAVQSSVILLRDEHAMAVLLLMLHDTLSGKCPRPGHLGIMVRSANSALLAKSHTPVKRFWILLLISLALWAFPPFCFARAGPGLSGPCQSGESACVIRFGGVK